MDCYFKIEKGDNETFSLLIKENNKSLINKKFKKENFTELDMFSILHLHLFSYQKEIKNISFQGNMTNKIKGISNRLQGAFKIDIKSIDAVNFNNNKVQEVDFIPEEAINEIKYISRPNIQEISYFYYKSLKKHIFNISTFDKGKLLSNSILSSDSPLLFSEETFQGLIKALENDANGEDYSLTMKIRSDKKYDKLLSTSIQEKLEFHLNKKVEIIQENELNNKIISFFKKKDEIQQKRNETLKLMAQDNNTTLFTDGSSRYTYESSAYIIKNGEKYENDINDSFLFDANTGAKYEEIALLKGLEKLSQKKLKGQLFIVSDREDNIHIINGLFSNLDFVPHPQIKNIYENVSKLIKNNDSLANIKPTFIAVKSHTSQIGYDFNGNRDVDKNAGLAIEVRDLSESNINTLNEIENNTLKGIDVEKLYKEHKKIVQEIKKNDPFSIIKNKKNISFSRRGHFETNNIYLNTINKNGKDYCCILFSKNGKNIKRDFFEYKSIGDYKSQLDLFLSVIPNNSFSNLRFFSNTDELNQATQEFVVSDAELVNGKLKELINKKMICVHSILEDPIYKRGFQHAGMKSIFQSFYENKVLGVTKREQRNKRTEEHRKRAESKLKKEKAIIDKNIIDDFSISNIHYQGSIDLIPRGHSLHNEHEYIFIKELPDEQINVTYILKNEYEKSIKVSLKDDYMTEINEILRNAPKTKSNKGLIVLTPNKELLNDFKKVINGEDFFNCNVLKILGKKYKDPKNLFIDASELPKDIYQLGWHKKNIATKTIKKNQKNKI